MQRTGGVAGVEFATVVIAYHIATMFWVVAIRLKDIAALLERRYIREGYCNGVGGHRYTCSGYPNDVLGRRYMHEGDRNDV